MDRIKIGFDIDEVALKYTGRFAEVFELFGGKSDLRGGKEFDFRKVIDVEKETNIMNMSFAYMMNEELEIYKDFEKLMREIIYTNKEIHFITARTEKLSLKGAKKSLEKVLYSMCVNPAFMSHVMKIDCVNGHGSKVPLIKESGLEYFVEDRRKNVLEISQEGIVVFMPRRSWNTLPEDTPNVIQYDNCDEILEYINMQTK